MIFFLHYLSVGDTPHPTFLLELGQRSQTQFTLEPTLQPEKVVGVPNNQELVRVKGGQIFLVGQLNRNIRLRTIYRNPKLDFFKAYQMALGLVFETTVLKKSQPSPLASKLKKALRCSPGTPGLPASGDDWSFVKTIADYSISRETTSSFYLIPFVDSFWGIAQ